jgi:predicted ester cyclase
MAREDNIAAVALAGPIAQLHDWDRLDEVFAPDVVDHDAVEGQPPGLEGMRWYWRNLTAAFPDLRFDPVVLSVDDDYATLVAHMYGTHTGVWRGHAPTGRRFSIRFIQSTKFADGLAVECWRAIDALGLLQQLGLA